MSAEQTSDVFSAMLKQADFSNEAINHFAKKLLSNKQPTLVSIGNLEKVPFLDDLKA